MFAYLWFIVSQLENVLLFTMPPEKWKLESYDELYFKRSITTRAAIAPG